jgi:predicted aspartyl protease
MGQTYTKCKIFNHSDVAMLKCGYIKPAELRFVEVNFIADTGAHSTFITEDIRQKLGLTEIGSKYVRVGGGARIKGIRCSPVQLLWGNRDIYLSPIVLPGQEEPILGVIAMEDLDVMVDPVTQTVKGAHGDEPLDMLL